MAKKPISPRDWRVANGYSLSQMADLSGVGGGDSRRSYYRKYEIGEAKAPLKVILAIERLSGGVVSIASWIAVREAWEKTHPAAQRTLAAA